MRGQTPHLDSWFRSHPVIRYMVMIVTPVVILLLYASIMGYPRSDALQYGMFFGVVFALSSVLIQKWAA